MTVKVGKKKSKFWKFLGIITLVGVIAAIFKYVSNLVKPIEDMDEEFKPEEQSDSMENQGA